MPRSPPSSRSEAPSIRAFLSIDNLTNVLTRDAFIAVIAVGQALVITGGGLDLSVGAMAAFVAGAMILFLNAGWTDNPILLISIASLMALGTEPAVSAAWPMA